MPAFKIVEGEFNIIVVFVVARRFCKLIRWPVVKHKTIFHITIETGDFFYDIPGKPVFNKFILFIFHQSFLEGQESPISFKAKYIYEFVKVETHT